MKTLTVVLAVSLSGCWHRQVLIPDDLTLQAFKELQAHAVSAGHRGRVSVQCLERSWAFHRLAAQLVTCREDTDCEVVVGRDPVGPVWLALSRSWRSTAGAEYELVGEACGDVDNLGTVAKAACRGGTCWLSKDPGIPLWADQ